MSELDGRVAIVTGAGHGHRPRERARALARAGAARDRRRHRRGRWATATAKAIKDAGGRALFVRTDVRSFDGRRAGCDRRPSRPGRGVDILVNNAARAIGGVVDEIDEDAWNDVIIHQSHLGLALHALRACRTCAAQGGGSIVNMSSVQSLRGFHGWAGLRRRQGRHQCAHPAGRRRPRAGGIRVNAVAPGTIMTPLNEKVFREAADPQELIDRWNAAHPLGRFGEADEVADAVLFLASDRSVLHHRRDPARRRRPGDQGRLTHGLGHPRQYLQALGIGHGGRRRLARRSPTASSSCCSGPPAAARPRRCGWSPDSRTRPRARSSSASATSTTLRPATATSPWCSRTTVSTRT